MRRLKNNPASLIDNALIVIGIFILCFCMTYYFYGDGAQRYQAMRSLVDNGHIIQSKYSLIGPMFSLPLHWIEKAFNLPPVFSVRYNFLLLIIAMAAFNFAFKGLLNDRVIKHFLLILLIGSMFTNNIRFYHGEVFTAMMVAAGLALVSKTRFAWGMTIIGVANTPATIVGYCIVLLLKIWQSKRLRYFGILAVCVALIILETSIRMGKIGLTGYESDSGFKTLMPYSGLPGFSYPLFFGIMSVLFSFGKGLLFFAPGLLLPVYSSEGHGVSNQVKNCYIAWICFLCGMILIYAKWWSWYGGWSFGPRFFLFASVPASLALAIHLNKPSRGCIQNILVIMVLALSVWVGISGAIFHLDKLEIGYLNRYALEHVVWYVPEFSVLWHPFVDRRELNWQDHLILVYGMMVFINLGFPIMVEIGHQLRQAAIALKNTLLAGDWKV